MQPSSQAEAEGLLRIAEKLLEEKDLNAARDFALLAQETEPLLEGSDQIMAIVDVLMAGDKRIIDNHHHWYAILQIDIHRIDDSEFVKQQYRRLALLLNPDKNNFALSESAFKLIGNAWSVLSDPETKTAYDKKFLEFLNVDLNSLNNQMEKDVQNYCEKMPVRRNSGNEQSSESLWTFCPYCYHLYEYLKVFEGCCLRCQKCDRAFQVVEIPTEALPTMVPGKETYSCSWPYFPIGFTISVSEMMKIATNRMPVERSSPLVDSLQNVSGVDGTPLESWSTRQPPENTAPACGGASVSRKRGKPVKNPLS